MKSRGTIGHCKDCGEMFPLADTARRMDIARGLSEPERCPECRKRRRREIKSKGAIFAEPPKETDDAKRCWGKFGLAYIARKPLVRISLADNSMPIDLPLRWREDPQSITDAHERKIAGMFSRIAPAAEALVKNLEDPNGARISILVGPTGTGKSTWVPYRILRSKIGEQGRICVTQPRLVTLKRSRPKDGLEDDSTTPAFIASQLLQSRDDQVRTSGVGPGHEVGYQFGGEYEQQDRYTKLLYVTDGTLINWLIDGRVGDFDVVFVDEAHEQSANMEQIFALLKYRLPLCPRLKVVIASATIDVERFRDYFGDGNPEAVFVAAPDDATVETPYLIHDRPLEDWVAEVPESSSLTHVLHPRDMLKRLPEVVPVVVRSIRCNERFTKLGEPNGDILVFVPTIRSADAVAKALKRLAHDQSWTSNVVVSHAQVSSEELSEFRNSETQAQVAARRGGATEPSRIIVATNYAETSVTMANVRFVVDSGLIMQPEWDSRTCSYSHDTKWHSKAGCTQRKGRVGRMQPGEYFRLFSAVAFETFSDRTPPELTRKPLDEFLLSAKAAGIEHLESFRWMSRNEGGPSGDDWEFTRSLTSITARGCLDSDGDITDHGVDLGLLRLSRVELADSLALADRFACAIEVATFLAFVGQASSPFARDEEGLLQYARWRAGCYDDVEFYLRLFFHWWKNQDAERDKWAKNERLTPEFFRKVLKMRDSSLASLQRRDEKRADRALDLDRLSRVRLVLARCLSEWTYVARADDSMNYEPYSQACPCAIPVNIDRDSACLVRPDLQAFVCLERVSRGNKIYARHIVQIEVAWLAGLRNREPTGMALLLQEHFRTNQRRTAQETAESILTVPPQLGARDFTVGQQVELRIVCPLVGDRELWLAEEVKTEHPVLFRSTYSRVMVGDQVSAEIVQCDPIKGRLVADQQRQSAAYVKYRPIAAARVVDLCISRNGMQAGFRVELEPGILAFLPERHLLVGTSQNLSVGDSIPVVVWAGTSKREICVAEASVFKRRVEDSKARLEQHLIDGVEDTRLSAAAVLLVLDSRHDEALALIANAIARGSNQQFDDALVAVWWSSLN